MEISTVVAIWIGVGVALILAEFVVPYLILVFFGVGAGLTGLLVWLGLPRHSGIPFAVFAAISIALLFGLRRVAKKLFKGLTSDVADTEPGFEEFVGREATVTSGFGTHGTKGRVAFRGTDWNAEGRPELVGGDRVRIVGRNGQNLRVEKL
jgi:membrane protein implicated in regulation of membrane protease activity